MQPLDAESLFVQPHHASLPQHAAIVRSVPGLHKSCPPWLPCLALLLSSAHSPGGGFVAAVAVVFIALGTEKRRHENKMQRVSITGNSTNLFSSQTAGGGLFEATEAVGDKGEDGEQKRGVLEVDASIRGRWEEDDDDDDEAMQHYCLSRARSLFTQADGYRSKMQFQKPQTQPPVLDPTNSLLSGLLLLHQGPTCAPELHRKRRFCMYFKAQREREGKGGEGSEHWVRAQGFDRRCARSGTRVFFVSFRILLGIL